MTDILKVSDFNHYREELTPYNERDFLLQSFGNSSTDLNSHHHAKARDLREFREFCDLMEDGLPEHTFELLDKKLKNIESVVDKKIYMKNLFSYLFAPSNVKYWLEINQLLLLSSGLRNWCSKQLDIDIGSVLVNSISKDTASIIFSRFVLNNDFTNASFYLDYAYDDLSKYKISIIDMIDKPDVSGINFMLSNLSNLYFENGILLFYSAKNTEIASLLLDKYRFDINTVCNGISFISKVVEVNNLNLFKILLSRHHTALNFTDDSIYNNILNTKNFDFITPLLTCSDVKSPQIKRIYEILFSGDIPDKLAYTQVYSALFNNPLFDHHIMNLGQGYFIYGLLSKLGVVSKKLGADYAKCYVHILDDYLSSIKDQYMPDSPDFHVVGAAVHVAQICHTQPTIDALTLVVRKFPNYLNKKNPNGFLPLEQVQSSSSIYQILLNNGAKKEITTTSIWGYLKSFFIKKEHAIDVETESMYPVVKNNSSSSISTYNVREQIRLDFNQIQQIIDVDGFDFELKILCENMFLLSDKLSILIENNPEIDFTTELHFLSQNFSNYLSKTLSTYVKFIKSNSYTPEQAENTKRIALKHINLITDQITLLTNNISSLLHDDTMNDLEIRTKFLESKFGKQG